MPLRCLKHHITFSDDVADAGNPYYNNHIFQIECLIPYVSGISLWIEPFQLFLWEQKKTMCQVFEDFFFFLYSFLNPVGS